MVVMGESRASRHVIIFQYRWYRSVYQPVAYAHADSAQEPASQQCAPHHPTLGTMEAQDEEKFILWIRLLKGLPWSSMPLEIMLVSAVHAAGPGHDEA